MAAVEKFLFGRDFEAEANEPAEKRTVPEQPPEPEPEPEPTYGEEELAAAVAEARKEAHAEGVAEGRRQAEAEADQALAQTLDRLSGAMNELLQTEAEHQERRDREQLQVAVQLMQRLFPALTRRHGTKEIEEVVQDSLNRLRDEPRVVVRIADSRLDALKEQIDKLTTKAGFDGKVVLLADDEIADGDVRVEWADGGAERDSDRLWREVDKAVQRALAPQSAAGKRKAEETSQTKVSDETEDTSPADEDSPKTDSEPEADAGAEPPASDASADAAPAARRSA